MLCATAVWGTLWVLITAQFVLSNKSQLFGVLDETAALRALSDLGAQIRGKVDTQASGCLWSLASLYRRQPVVVQHRASAFEGTEDRLSPDTCYRAESRHTHRT